MADTDINITEATITARISRACHGYRCHRAIAPGEQYVRLVAFPNADVNGGTQPWVMCLCVYCYREYDVDKPLPPRRHRRARP